MGKNKRGVEINIATIIILVLAILVLVILALYFTGGMRSLWDRIRGTNTIYNENDISMARQLCESREIVSFCSQRITIPAANGTSTELYCDDKALGAKPKYSNGTIIKDYDCSLYR
jgi:Tfp pilus assembly protein PilX